MVTAATVLSGVLVQFEILIIHKEPFAVIYIIYVYSVNESIEISLHQLIREICMQTTPCGIKLTMQDRNSTPFMDTIF